MGQVGSRSDCIYVGKNAESGFKNVWLDTRGAHALYVMGKRRSGKSFTLGVIAEGLAADGWIRQGATSQGVLLLDTMNVYLTLPHGVIDTLPEDSEEVREHRRWQLAGQPRAVLFHPSGTNPPPGVESQVLTLRASDLGPDEWCGLFEVDPFSDPLGHLMTELHGKVALDGYLDADGHPHDADPLFGIDALLAALDGDPDLQRFHRDTLEALRRRLVAIRRLPIFSDQGLDVTQLLRPGQISVLLLRDIDQQMRSSLVALIVKQMMTLRGVAEQEERMEAVHRNRAQRFAVEDPERSAREEVLAAQCRTRASRGLARSWLIIDEAHNYIPAVGVTPSRKPLKKYVDEGRNLGLSIVVATQNPSGLDPSIQRNADLLLVHSLSRHDDIAAAEGMVNCAPPTEISIDGRQRFEGSRSFEQLVRALPIGYALASTDRANRLFPVRIRPRVSLHGGGDY